MTTRLRRRTRPWTQQPPRDTRANPNVEGLLALWSGTSPDREIFGGTYTTGGGNTYLLEYVPSKIGQAQTSNVASDFISTSFGTGTALASEPFALLAYVEVRAVGTARSFIVSGAESLTLGITSTGEFQGSTVRASTTVTSPVSYSVGDVVAVAYVLAEGEFSLWINGSKVASIAQSLSVLFFNRTGLNIQGPGFNIAAVALFAGAGALRAGRYTANPWALFARRALWIPYEPPATVPTLSGAAVTAITSTGATPRVTITF